VAKKKEKREREGVMGGEEPLQTGKEKNPKKTGRSGVREKRLEVQSRHIEIKWRAQKT